MTRCAGCNQSIQGQYMQALKRNWHPDCFRCGACGKPIKDRSFQEQDGTPFHVACWTQHHAPRCDLCGDVRTREYIKDAWGNQYCAHHQKKCPPCFACGRLVSKGLTCGGQKYPDGRHVCALCFGSAVFDQPKAQQLFEEMRHELERMGFAFNDAPLPFRLVSKKELEKNSKRKRKSRPALGTAKSTVMTRNKRVVSRKLDEIIIMNGLSEDLFRLVAAHELCHAWLLLKGFPILPDRVEEGLCTLVESLWLQQQRDQGSAIRLKSLQENPDPIYGNGYRAARAALGKMSLAKLLAHVHKNGRFPGDRTLSRFFGGR